MAIVEVTAPKINSRIAYGAANLIFAPGATDNVPTYVAKFLVNHGFTCSEDLSVVDVRAELASASAQEISYFMLANNDSTIADIATLQKKALAIFDAVGTPV